MDGIQGKNQANHVAESASSGSVSVDSNENWTNRLIESMLAEAEQDSFRRPEHDLALNQFIGQTTSDDLEDDAVESENEEELEQLLEIRKEIGILLGTNEKYSNQLKSAISQVRVTIEETAKLKEYLDRADGLSQHLSRCASIPLHSEAVKLPLFPDIYQEIPRIAYHAKQVDDLRISLSNFEWSDKDVESLKEIVLRQCKKIEAIRLSESGSTKDIFDAISKTAPDDLLRHSIPSSNEESLDWTLVARQLGETHTPEDCRTRWLMKERPGVNQKDWTQDELALLRKSLLRYEGEEGEEINWESISHDVGSGRLAIDCFRASQKNGFLDDDNQQEESLTVQDEEQIRALVEIWGSRSGMIREHLQRPVSRSAMDAYIAQLKSEKAPDTWLFESDVELVRHLSRIVKSTRQVILRDPWRVGNIDWDANFPKKPSGVTSSDVKHRWERIVRDSKIHPQKYLDTKKRAVEEDLPASPRKRRGRPPKNVKA